MNETLYRWTFNFHKVVQQQNSGAVEDFILPYSAVYLRLQTWKNYWNRSTFAKVIVKIKVARFLMAHGVHDLLHYHQQLVHWDPPVSWRHGSISNPRDPFSRHQLSGTLCLQLRKVPLPKAYTITTFKAHLKTKLFSAAAAFLLLPAPLIRTLDINMEM